MVDELRAATAVLVGKTLWTCRRAADMATFQFGAKTKTVDYFKRPTEVGEYALHVQCAWSISRADRVIVGSRDLYYPADYQDKTQDISPDFDWDQHPNRRDKLILQLFQNGTKGFLVEKIDVGMGASLTVHLKHDLCLRILPDDSLDNGQWRLFRPEVDQPHLVVTGNGLEQ